MARELVLPPHPLLSTTPNRNGVSEAEGGPTIDAPGAAPAGRAWLVLTDRRQTLGALLIVGAVVAAFGAWWQVSGTTYTAQQLAYIASGGLGAGCLILIGMVLLMASEHARDRLAISQVVLRLENLEQGLSGEFDHLETLITTTKTRPTTDPI